MVSTRELSLQTNEHHIVRWLYKPFQTDVEKQLLYKDYPYLGVEITPELQTNKPPKSLYKGFYFFWLRDNNLSNCFWHLNTLGTNGGIKIINTSY